MSSNYDFDLAKSFHEETSADLLAHDKKKLKTELIERAGIKNPKKWNVLDIGCAGGVHVKFLAETYPNIKSLTGLDLSPNLIEIAKKENSDSKIEYVVGSMDKMPFPDDSFDFIFSRNTIHYSENLEKTFNEVARVMKIGSRFYFQDSHPIFTLFLKESKDYEKKENVTFPIQGGKVTHVVHPSYMLSEYISAILKSGLRIIAYNEYFGRRSQVGEFRLPVTQGWTLEK